MFESSLTATLGQLQCDCDLRDDLQYFCTA